nr:titin-like [Leptinotarsa decemlineata]
MEVVALVHAGRGEFLDKVPEVADVPRFPEMEIERVPEIETPGQQPIPMEIVEPEAPAIAAIEKHLPTAEITPAISTTEEGPIISDIPKKVDVPKERPVLQEIQSLAEPVEELREQIAKLREPRKKAEDARKKAGRAVDKLFLKNKRKGFVRINRCNENEGRFVDQSYRLPTEFRNVHNEILYNIFWFEEEVDGVRDEVRAGSSVRSSSLRTSLALARTPSRLTRSTLEKDLTDSLRRPLSETETPQKEMPSLGMGEVLIGSEERPRQLPIEEPPVPVRPPSREKTSILEQEPLTVTIGEEPPVVQPSVPEFSMEGVAPTEEVSVPLEIVPTVREELVPSVQELPPPTEKLLTPTAEKKETTRIPKSPASDYRLRQQKIVGCIKTWNFTERFPTIEDICEKPMTKINMARAFSDLLVLSAKKYLILCSEGVSTELKYIKKGPRLE